MAAADVRLNRLEALRDYLWVPVPILLVVAVLTYGIFAFGVLVEKNEGECVYGRTRGGELSTAVEIREGFLPLEYTCFFANGTVEERIPSEANLVVFGSLAGAVASLAAAIRLSQRIKRQRSSAASPG